MRVSFDVRFGGWGTTMLTAARSLLDPYDVADLKLRVVTVEPVDSPHKTSVDIAFGALTSSTPDLTMTIEGSDHDVHELVRRCSASNAR